MTNDKKKYTQDLIRHIHRCIERKEEVTTQLCLPRYLEGKPQYEPLPGLIIADPNYKTLTNDQYFDLHLLLEELSIRHALFQEDPYYQYVLASYENVQEALAYFLYTIHPEQTDEYPRFVPLEAHHYGDLCSKIRLFLITARLKIPIGIPWKMYYHLLQFPYFDFYSLHGFDEATKDLVQCFDKYLAANKTWLRTETGTLTAA